MRRFLLLTIIFSLTACQQPTTYGPQVTAEELRAEEARQEHMVREAAERGGTTRPWRKRKGITREFNSVADRIDKAGGQLCQEMGLPQKYDARCYYYFKLAIDKSDLNAYADGKTVVIYSGMMHFLENENEVAVVLAHELAHNLMGHVDATRTNITAGALLGAVVDSVAASQGISTGGGISNLGASAALLSYSSAFEQEADYVGLYIAARAGYDIREAPDLWRRMTLENPDSLFREVTHPSNPRRAATMERAIYEIEYKRKHRLSLVPDFKEN